MSFEHEKLGTLRFHNSSVDNVVLEAIGFGRSVVVRFVFGRFVFGRFQFNFSSSALAVS